MASVEHEIGKLDAFAEDTPVAIKAGRVELVAVRHGDEVHVVSSRCPHRGASMKHGSVRMLVTADDPDGMDLGGECLLVCPWHGYEFLLSTGELPFPGDMRLRSYPATVRDGSVFVSLRTSEKKRRMV